MSTPSIAQLQRAIQISEQIEKLNGELETIMNWVSSGKSANNAGVAAHGPKKRGRPRKAMPTAVEGIETSNDVVAGGRKKKRKMSVEARERIAAAQRARWAKAKRAK